MDINKMLGDLRVEREQIEEAIMTLERLARGRGRTSWTPTSLDVADQTSWPSSR